MVEFVQLTTECCWGQPSDPCQRGCLTSHACVMWGPRTLNADDDDDDDDEWVIFRDMTMTWRDTILDKRSTLAKLNCSD